MIRERERERWVSLSLQWVFFIILIMLKFLMVVVLKMPELSIVWLVIDLSHFFFLYTLKAIQVEILKSEIFNCKIIIFHF